MNTLRNRIQTFSLLLSVIASAAAARSPAWGGVFADAGASEVSVAPDAGALRSRVAIADKSLFEPIGVGDVLLMNLFSDASYGCRVERVEGKVFSGIVQGVPGGSFACVFDRGVLVGYIRIPGSGVFRVHGSSEALGEEAGSGRLVRISQLAPEIGEGCGENSPPVDDAGGADAGRGDEGAGDGVGDGSVIDVMVLYTPRAQSAAGGLADILAEIDLSVASANIAYENSGIGFALRLVHTQLVDYDEQTGSSFSTHLSRLRATNDGIIDEVHQLRNDHGADLVSMLINDSGLCGTAYTMRTLSPSFQSSAFSVVKWSCAAGSLSFPHELGHNMGACHAPGDGCSGGLFDDSNGHRFYGQGGHQWRTVMAYSPGTRVTQFSNPGVLFDGTASGIAGEADNARTLNEAALVVSNFRAAHTPCLADMTGEGVLNFFDISIFLAEYGGGSLGVDFTGDGVLNFFDVSAFLVAYNAGCP